MTSSLAINHKNMLPNQCKSNVNIQQQGHGVRITSNNPQVYPNQSGMNTFLTTTGGSVMPTSMSAFSNNVYSQVCILLDTLQMLLHNHLFSPTSLFHQTQNNRSNTTDNNTNVQNQHLSVFSFYHMFLEIKTFEFWQSVVAECTSSFLLNLIVLNVATSSTDYAYQTNAAIANGIVISVLTYCFSGMSGGYLTPTITFAMLLSARISPLRTLFYIGAHCGGAIGGAAVVHSVQQRINDPVLFPITRPFSSQHSYTSNSNYNAKLQQNVNLLSTVLPMEFILSVIIVLTFCNVSTSSRSSSIMSTNGNNNQRLPFHDMERQNLNQQQTHSTSSICFSFRQFLGRRRTTFQPKNLITNPLLHNNGEYSGSEMLNNPYQNYAFNIPIKTPAQFFETSNSIIVGLAYSASTIGWKRACLNPARALASALISKRANRFFDHWIFWIGPTMGSIVAVIIHRYVFNVEQRRYETRSQMMQDTLRDVVTSLNLNDASGVNRGNFNMNTRNGYSQQRGRNIIFNNPRDIMNQQFDYSEREMYMDRTNFSDPTFNGANTLRNGQMSSNRLDVPPRQTTFTQNVTDYGNNRVDNTSPYRRNNINTTNRIYANQDYVGVGMPNMNNNGPIYQGLNSGVNMLRPAGMNAPINERIGINNVDTEMLGLGGSQSGVNNYNSYHGGLSKQPLNQNYNSLLKNSPKMNTVNKSTLRKPNIDMSKPDLVVRGETSSALDHMGNVCYDVNQDPNVSYSTRNPSQNNNVYFPVAGSNNRLNMYSANSDMNTLGRDATSNVYKQFTAASNNNGRNVGPTALAY